MDTASNPSHRIRPQKVPFRERAFVAGNFIGVNGYRVNQAALAQQIASSGYHIHETTHFMICTQTHSPTILVHRFAPVEIDADLGRYFMQELKPLGLLAQPQDYGSIFAAVVGSLSPADPQRAWHLFGTTPILNAPGISSEPTPCSVITASWQWRVNLLKVTHLSLSFPLPQFIQAKLLAAVLPRMIHLSLSFPRCTGLFVNLSSALAFWTRGVHLASYPWFSLSAFLRLQMWLGSISAQTLSQSQEP